ncbi:hypothetical protein HK096_009733 [Nowakowskiella sp. JEL0078]|nr:hypothetical protein HK096_009733 [Nowakowskiella sp. JEL0078]
MASMALATTNDPDECILTDENVVVSREQAPAESEPPASESVESQSEALPPTPTKDQKDITPNAAILNAATEQNLAMATYNQTYQNFFMNSQLNPISPAVTPTPDLSFPQIAQYPYPPPYYHPMVYAAAQAQAQQGQSQPYLGYPYRPPNQPQQQPVSPASRAPTPLPTISSSLSNLDSKDGKVQTPPRGRPRKKATIAIDDKKEDKNCECENCKNAGGDAGADCLRMSNGNKAAAGNMVRPHVCGECGQGFHREHDLSRHHKTRHLGLRPFHCDVCDKSFSRSDAYKRHKLTEETRASRKRAKDEASPTMTPPISSATVPKKKRKGKDEENEDEDEKDKDQQIVHPAYDPQQMYMYQQQMYRAAYPYPFPYPMPYPQMTEQQIQQQRALFMQHQQMQQQMFFNQNQDGLEKPASEEKSDDSEKDKEKDEKKDDNDETMDAESGEAAEGDDAEDGSEGDGEEKKKEKMAPKMRAKKMRD